MANLLTGLRLLLIIPVSRGFALPGAVPAGLLLGLVLLAIASDLLDGTVARKLGTASARGMLFDHSTDFLFVTASLGALAYVNSVPILLPILIFFAFSQYVLDSYLLFRQKQLRMSFLGRWNGILYFVPLLTTALAGLNLTPILTEMLPVLTRWLAYGLIGTTIVSIIDRSLAPRHQQKNSG